ncbi:chromate transporter, chromate ion transporter (CHR) family [[Leptolyngbya] sp. PCC 7376]|uniref:chromate efflux transporter n=1 Tax=[Leptolyngbya] sp. PCC 7376 TaxID=111781 RepID=UPI00029F141B|nr:chromate efflux transporter [[Leptolyngbya] sp. PCC 7376]AFY40596.1 chromate transporter, chromate ion transporter (CHR) family [[Leptolyngbya] sp. PCC 7376]
MVQWSRLGEVSKLSLKLGFTAFGGPIAIVAMMHDEFVARREWLSEQEFLDFFGATNLLPGSNSMEMASHIGYHRAGWLGLWVGGICFTAPSIFLMVLFCWVYVHYGASPQGEWLLYGVKPVAIALIAQALWQLGKGAIKGKFAIVLAFLNIGLSIVGLHELALLLASGIFSFIVKQGKQLLKPDKALAIAPLPFLAPLSGFSFGLGSIGSFSLSWLFLMFFKVGTILYGSGYVLLAFLRGDFVERLGWLTDQQLLDAIAIGQITPGPLSTTATFIGFLLGGFPGAGIATLGMFLPGFILISVLHPILPKLNQSEWFRAFLDGVNIGALSLMAVVTAQLAQSSLVDPLTITVAIASLFLLVKFKVNSVWLVLGGMVIGLGASFMPGVVIG